MAFRTPLLIILTTVALFMISDVESVRDIPSAPKLGSEPADCWSAVAEIRSCSNEIIGFFLNGQMEIDEPCCKAIGVVAQQCGSGILGSLGFNAEGGNLLEGFCEKSYGDVVGAFPVLLHLLLQSPPPSSTPSAVPVN